jgi:hypothetical protein
MNLMPFTKTTQMTKHDAYRKGYDSYLRCVPLINNPHMPGTQEHVYWDQGWIQGRLEGREK